MIDASVPVVLFRSAPGRLPGLGVARTLGRLGVPVHLVGSDDDAAVASSRYVVSRHEDLPDAPASERVESLRSVAAGIGGRPILIPTDDAGTLFVEDHRDALAPSFLFPEQPPGLVRQLASKAELFGLCRLFEVPTPRVARPSSRDHLRSFLGAASFPIVVKAVEQRVGGGPQRSVAICRNAEEVLERFGQGPPGEDPNLLLQEYIPGGPESVWMFNGYFDGVSECRFGATGRKLRQHPPYTGYTTLGVTARNETVERQTTDLMRSLSYRGILDIGFRFDARDGRYKLLDANPRVGATFRLFVGSGGMDVVRALYLDLSGQTIPEDEVPDGRRWIVEIYDPGSSLTYLRNRELTPRGWARSLRGVREGALVARDDLRPVLHTFASLVRSALVIPRSRDRRHDSGEDHRSRVESRFARRAPEWRDVYTGRDVRSTIYQERLARALEEIDRLDLPPGSRALDLGAGAGLTSVALAERGLRVHALDRVTEMLAQASDAARAAGLERSVTTVLGDASALPYDDASFDLVVALGVVPWLGSPESALAEIARILRPGGHAIVTADNRKRLVHLADPWRNPTLAPIRTWVRGLLGTSSTNGRIATLHAPEELDALLTNAGLTDLHGSTLGFGPFTFARRPVLPEPSAARVHAVLQGLADRGFPVVRSRGSQVLVVARRDRDRPRSAMAASAPRT
jgi:D-aspartate ligase